MLESLITSKTRIKLLLKFFLNSNTRAHLRGLEGEFHESTNGIRLELNRFELAGLLSAHTVGNRKFYSANTNHPLFIDIQHLVHKHIGLDQVIEHVIQRLGEIDRVYLTGSFARGQESKVIELIFVAGKIDQEYMNRLITKANKMINRDIQYTIVENDLVDPLLKSVGKENLLLLWQQAL